MIVASDNGSERKDFCKIHEDLWSINKIHKDLIFLWFLCAKDLVICENFRTFAVQKNIFIFYGFM